MDEVQNGKRSGVKIVTSAGCHDCGGRCPLKVHIRDGVIVRTRPDDSEEPQLKACLRGYAYRQLVYHPDRLKYPMKRIGERGEGKFARISWDEALDTIASELKRVKEVYGNASILPCHYSGNPSALHGVPAMLRLFSLFGGYTNWWGLTSREGWVAAQMINYGTRTTGNSRDDLLNSKLIIMWGWNPAETICGTGTAHYLSLAKEKGIKIIAVDPRFHDSAAAFADQWIPVKPGTDAAVLCAMAYVIASENLHDRKFLDKYTTGFDKFNDYIMGVEDGLPKTPAWAERISGVPAQTIINLAREYALARPAALIDGLGAGRTATGEQTHRASMTLAAMTGNIGISGGNPGGAMLALPIGDSFQMPHMPIPRNPVEAGMPSERTSYDSRLRSRARVHVSKFWDAILKGKEGGYPADFKLFYVICSNPINQFPNSNKGAQALRKIDFVIVQDLFMTATARFADILLPVTTPREQNDLYRPYTSGPYYLFSSKAIEPYYECKSDHQIALELATRLGISNFSDKTEDEWLREFVVNNKETAREIQDYDKFRREGVHKVHLAEPIISFKKQIEDPENNPFPTPSGKIQIFLQALEDLKNPLCPPVPKYVEYWEGPNDPMIKKYPLQLITPHLKRRAHTIFDNLPWLRELQMHAAWINPADAKIRGITDGQEIKVFNDRGTIIIPAHVTERIMPGVVSVTQGAWYNPDENGIDRGGCANTLCRDDYSPLGAFACNTALVQVQKVS